MFFYSKRAFLRRATKRPVKKSYRVRRTVENSMRYFDASYLLGKNDDNDEDESNGPQAKPASAAEIQPTALSFDERRKRSKYDSPAVDNVTNVRLSNWRSTSMSSTEFTWLGRGQARVRHFIAHCGAATLCVTALYSILIVLSECVGCLVEMFVFTLMGIIVNAGSLLKFVALAVMLVAYSYDCFNNVEKKYLKLNKALFSEVKGRIKDLEKVTSLPSFLQENRGFKSQELSEQADYETSDDVAVTPARHWLINDLVLFIDNEDMPRIPRKLFEDVCRIRVAGVPGPIYRGHLDAMKHFLKIVVFIFFVFVVIMSFGRVYQVSSTNQMIAALAGGSLPFILRTVMQPEKPEIEIGTVSFKNQMDEIIKNFVQCWPIYDLPLEEYTAEDEEKDRQKKEEQAAAAEAKTDAKTRARLSVVSEDTSTPFLDMLNEQPGVERDHVDDSVLAGDAVGSPAAGQRVCFDVEPEEERGESEVDIVIYLPQKPSETWLDEWSDLDDVDDAASSGVRSHENDVFPLSQL